MNNTLNKFVGQISILVGIIFIIYALIPMFIPLSLIVLGIFLIYYGLSLMDIKIYKILFNRFISGFFKFK